MNQAIIKDSNSEYHAQTDYIGSSGLKMIYKKSVDHYLRSKKMDPTDSMRLGTAVHTALLEPDKFNDEITVMPELNLRTKAGREERDKLLELSGKKLMIKNDDLYIIKSIEMNFKNNSLALSLCRGGVIEASHYGYKDDIKIRCRPDVYQPISKTISDIKTCQDNSPKAFKSDIYKYGYHLQAVFYCEALSIITGHRFDPINFRFITVETKYPFTCQVYALGQKEIEYGYQAMDKAWQEWKLFKDTGVVLGYQTEQNTPDGALIL